MQVKDFTYELPQELIAQSKDPVRQFGERVQKYLLYTD